MLNSTRRKVEALREIIKQIDLELGPFLVDDLNNDPMVAGQSRIVRCFSSLSLFARIEIMEKWSRLQSLASDKDERLKDNRKQWKHFKRQLEDLEQASQQFANLDGLCNYSSLSSAFLNVSSSSAANSLLQSGCPS